MRGLYARLRHLLKADELGEPTGVLQREVLPEAVRTDLKAGRRCGFCLGEFAEGQTDHECPLPLPSGVSYPGQQVF